MQTDAQASSSKHTHATATALQLLRPFLDEILTPALVLLLPQERDESRRTPTGTLIAEWLEANGYKAIATSLNEVLASNTPLTDTIPHKAHLEELLQARHDRLQQERASVQQIYQASVLFISRLANGEIPFPREDRAIQTCLVAADNSQSDENGGSHRDALNEIDGESMEMSPSGELSDPTPISPQPAAVSAPQEANGASASDYVPTQNGHKRRRQNSLSDYTSTDDLPSLPLPIARPRTPGAPSNMVNQNLVCKRNGKGRYGAELASGRQAHIAKLKSLRVHPPIMPFPTLQSSVE